MTIVYSADYELALPQTHPFPMRKFRQAQALAAAELSGAHFVEPETVSMDDLLRVHVAGYLDDVICARLCGDAAVKLGLPVTAALFPRSALETGGTLTAARIALREGRAANGAGGTHHAFPDRGLGYCVLNDVAVAARVLQAAEPRLRILVIDTDAHQGNGTAAIFEADPGVFTFSIHVGANYPSRKERSDLDVPLPRQVGGAEYLAVLQQGLEEAMHRANPKFVFWIAGADPHESDLFGQMKLTTSEIMARDELVAARLVRAGIPWVVLYGGGYSGDHTARLHANTLAVAAAA